MLVADGWYRPTSVPMPGWGKATMICFATALVQFAGGLFLQLAWLTGDLSPTVANLLATPLTFMLGVVMLYGMLPTTFSRACVVFLLHFVFLTIINLLLFVSFGGLELLQR
jgi:hypothetical protein